MPMEGLKRRLSFRKKKKDKVPECSKPHQWQEDEKKVRDGTCSFQVRYLGCVEVFESRGMQVCEEAVKTLKTQCKGKYQRAILYVSGDALRVVDEISKSMIVDQTIEKVSFCAPDRNHEKGFAYICRDGTTRRWMCHGFLAVKESKFWRSQKVKGERLSHAVGCAFAICLERKQKRDKESGASNVTVTYSQDRTTFERTGSFRQTTITERITDPQSAIVAEPVPVKMVDNPHAVQRPHATQNLLLRQGSFRGFSKLQEASSPFKRTLSLRLNELPSTLQRQNAVEISPPKSAGGINNNGVIQEMPSPENDDSIAQMCQQLTQGLHAMSGGGDIFSSVSHTPGLVKQHSMPVTFHTQQPGVINHPAPPIHETNPWAMPPSPAHSSGSGSGASTGATPKDPYFGRASPSTNPFLASQAPNGIPATGTTTVPTPPHLQAHSRSHSIDTSNLSSWQPQAVRKQTLLEMAHHQSFQINGGGAVSNDAWPPTSDWTTSSVQTSNTSTNVTTQNQSNKISSTTDTFDPFDVAWAARTANKKEGAQTNTANVSNPFATKTVTTYKVEL